MNKKILASLVGIVAVLGLIAGGTFAAWSDYDVITGNATEAGHLTLDMQTPSGAINNVGGQAIAPGESRTIDFFVASADLDGVPLADLSMTVQNLVDSENACPSNSEQDVDASCGDPGVGDGEFSDEAFARIRYTDAAPVGSITVAPNSCTAPSGYVNSVGYSPASNNDSTVYPRLDTLTAASALGQLGPNEGICIRIDLGLDPNATNRVQTDSSTFDLRFDLAQA